ncbi:MAG: hypothetical protein WD557_18265 [Dehalococcoidia bacterium]
MSQAPSSVIYLPPGVIPQAGPPPGLQPSGIPFDRAFFERLLPQAVQSFCSQVKCDLPVVEVYTLDGTRHFVNAISGVTDTFVALQTSVEDHDHTVQAFIPYQTIYRVEIHPEGDSNRGRLGFALDAKTPPAIQAAAEPDTERPAASKARKRRGARG